jgi:hypothetical protein
MCISGLLTASVIQRSDFLAADTEVPGFDSRRYQIFGVAVGLEGGPLCLMSINEELVERKNSCSGLEN